MRRLFDFQVRMYMAKLKSDKLLTDVVKTVLSRAEAKLEYSMSLVCGKGNLNKPQVTE